tara:strand:+ start:1195 stop:1617 length:423 start_codon:yes stop_codon:yes gene_type:complete
MTNTLLPNSIGKIIWLSFMVLGAFRNSPTIIDLILNLVFAIIVYCLGVFLYLRIFKNKINDDIKDTQETVSKIPSEIRNSDKYYQSKKDAGLINVESGGENAGLINIESGGEESGGYMPKFFALFFIILFSLIFWIALTS